ncbi:MAG: hypothetical protein ABII90_00195 [Bacteroidota bacterium]
MREELIERFLKFTVFIYKKRMNDISLHITLHFPALTGGHPEE